MKPDFDKLLKDCDEHMGACGTCEHYNDCLSKFPPKNKMNNPSMLFWEMQNNKLSYEPKAPQAKINYKISITEAPDSMIKHSVDIMNSLPIETRKIAKSAVEKFVASRQEDATIVSLKDNMYHFIFECSDCFAMNDFTDYCLNNEVSFHCRYCGKKHTFSMANVIKKEKGNNEEL